MRINEPEIKKSRITINVYMQTGEMREQKIPNGNVV